MDFQIAESIMGDWFKGKSVNDRYGRISDQELIQAIDRMTFDHGETEILVSQPDSKKKANWMVTGERLQRRKARENLA